MELLLQGLGEGREGEARQALHMLEEWQAVADRDGLVAGPDDEQQHLVGQGDDRQLGGRHRQTLVQRYLNIPVPNSSVFHTIAWLRHFGGQPWISCVSPTPGRPCDAICNQSPCACCHNRQLLKPHNQSGRTPSPVVCYLHRGGRANFQRDHSRRNVTPHTSQLHAQLIPYTTPRKNHNKNVQHVEASMERQPTRPPPQGQPALHTAQPTSCARPRPDGGTGPPAWRLWLSTPEHCTAPQTDRSAWPPA